ncbi:MAG TPA: hypothetical protein VFR09_02185, partial [Alphaproteobacteria bacterium]|nr:hypothetical protein [Alphaproteobacteria bacterium]
MMSTIDFLRIRNAVIQERRAELGEIQSRPRRETMIRGVDMCAGVRSLAEIKSLITRRHSEEAPHSDN